LWRGFAAGRSTDTRTEDEGIFVGPDDGKALLNPIGGRMVVKVRDEDTGGGYSIHDNTIPPGSPGPRPHIHRHHDETFYALEGELTVRVETRKITAPTGSFVVVPRGWTTFWQRRRIRGSRRSSLPLPRSTATSSRQSRSAHRLNHGTIHSALARRQPVQLDRVPAQQALACGLGP
jgi:mannose-6-phosphate isomerase-like protein (cupin superfamily)